MATHKFTMDVDVDRRLSADARVQYYADFLTDAEQEILYRHLGEGGVVPWRHGVYNMYGRDVQTPRLLWAMRDDGAEVNAKYKVTDSSPWTPELEAIKVRIEEKVGRALTYAQLNNYRSGDDYIGWHSDRELQPGDVIASLSLGCARRFVLRSKADGTKYEFRLRPGSLLVMNYECAKTEFKHTVPKEPKVREGRINVTFRNK